MKTVYSDDHRLHAAKKELVDGTLMPAHERPQRADIILARVREVGLGEILAPEDFGVAPLARVHDGRYLAFLESAWDMWKETGREWDALPLVWPVRGLRAIEPEDIDGKLSYFSFDAGAPITAGTWPAVRASANVALTAARLVKDGERVAFGLCRPPGHHAAADYCGGYCFLNNAAIAAQWLRDQGAQRISVLDIDYHHGNGTQSIFYERADVQFLSLHGDPRQEYPYFLGYADEIGAGRGEGYNVNYPMEWGTAYDAWGQALKDACHEVASYAPDAVVVSLGVDTFEKDPISQFKLKSPDYLDIGKTMAGLGLPTVILMEGGYAVDEIGINAVNVLTGFDDAV
ncbi:histone deacetylase family protein [Microbaculum marinisediminis]|uniref:Histone deacetylase family protein n=1 Tax=Microbaculum marinisediminis TaxID=2931392 RepID=A0AAW5QZ68_9HYPH|nr:histone deacetylase family protein [Microbaculum sp. A6E488]MCT8972427.1 histone deacetylase family protein [Microbaculum sp. A6E488]